MRAQLTHDVIELCREQLLAIRSELMNRIRGIKSEFGAAERGGDEIDNSVALLTENNLLLNQERLRVQMLEVELALARIEEGRFGICEETEELIERDRLIAIPWTRLSIEGAEIREDLQRRFAR